MHIYIYIYRDVHRSLQDIKPQKKKQEEHRREREGEFNEKEKRRGWSCALLHCDSLCASSIPHTTKGPLRRIHDSRLNYKGKKKIKTGLQEVIHGKRSRRTAKWHKAQGSSKEIFMGKKRGLLEAPSKRPVPLNPLNKKKTEEIRLGPLGL